MCWNVPVGPLICVSWTASRRAAAVLRSATPPTGSPRNCGEFRKLWLWFSTRGGKRSGPDTGPEWLKESTEPLLFSIWRWSPCFWFSCFTNGTTRESVRRPRPFICYLELIIFQFSDFLLSFCIWFIINRTRFAPACVRQDFMLLYIQSLVSHIPAQLLFFSVNGKCAIKSTENRKIRSQIILHVNRNKNNNHRASWWTAVEVVNFIINWHFVLYYASFYSS